jgi:hypothetical protein
MDPKLKALADAPLANPLAINLPEGRRSQPREVAPAQEHRPGDLTKTQLAERKRDEEYAKLSKLFDYYATTDIPVERVAAHVGVYRMVEVGSEDGKPVYERQLDIERVRQELDFRRKGLRAGSDTDKGGE